MGQGSRKWGWLAALLLAPGCAQQHWSPPPKPSPAHAHSSAPGQKIPPMAQAEVLVNLSANKFALLDSHFSELQREYVGGTLSDEDLRNAFRVFYPANPALEAKYDAWVGQFPKSYVAHVARGIYLKKLGQESRGDDFIQNTGEKQIDGMNRAFEKAMTDFHASAELSEKPLLTYVHALDITRYYGTADESRELLDLATTIDPGSFIARQKYMIAIEPRWGGSMREMQDFLEESRKANVSARHLQILQALIIEEQAAGLYDRHNYAEAAPLYRQAMDLGDGLVCAACAAYAMSDQKQYADAVKAYTMMLQENPSDPDTLSKRAYAYSQLENPQAIADYTAAANLGNAYSQNALGKYSMNGVPGIVPVDREAAINWFRKAAAQGDAEGIKNLNEALKAAGTAH
jgi:TPR repeat protein